MISGRTNPERWRAHRSGLGRWECHLERKRDVLDELEVRRIADEAAGIEKRFGRPLDLEWAYDDTNELWWLQARPLTVFAPPPS